VRWRLDLGRRLGNSIWAVDLLAGESGAMAGLLNPCRKSLIQPSRARTGSRWDGSNPGHPRLIGRPSTLHTPSACAVCRKDLIIVTNQPAILMDCTLCLGYFTPSTLPFSFIECPVQRTRKPEKTNGKWIFNMKIITIT
jgi:hypothetical protein